MLLSPPTSLVNQCLLQNDFKRSHDVIKVSNNQYISTKVILLKIYMYIEIYQKFENL